MKHKLLIAALLPLTLTACNSIPTEIQETRARNLTTVFNKNDYILKNLSQANMFLAPEGFDFKGKELTFGSRYFFLDLGKVKNAENVTVDLGMESFAVVDEDFDASAFASFSNKGITHKRGTPLIIKGDVYINVKDGGPIKDPVELHGSFYHQDYYPYADLLVFDNDFTAYGLANFASRSTNFYKKLTIEGGDITFNDIEPTEFKMAGGTLTVTNYFVDDNNSYSLTGGKLNVLKSIKSLDHSGAFTINGTDVKLGESIANNTVIKSGSITIDSDASIFGSLTVEKNGTLKIKASEGDNTPNLDINGKFTLRGQVEFDEALESSPVIFADDIDLSNAEYIQGNGKYSIYHTNVNGRYQIYFQTR